MLDAKFEELDYFQSESSGADGEVEFCEKKGIPVFTNIPNLYGWAGK